MQNMENKTNLPIHSLFVGMLHTPVDKQTLSWLKAGSNPLSHWNEHLSNVFPRQFWLNLPFSNEREHGFVAENKKKNIIYNNKMMKTWEKVIQVKINLKSTGNKISRF